MKNYVKPVLMLFALTLSACGGAPSGDDIKSAVTGKLANKMEWASDSLDIPKMISDMNVDVRNVKCDEFKKSYKCSYDLTIEIGTGKDRGKRTEATKSTFTKIDGTWFFGN